MLECVHVQGYRDFIRLLVNGSFLLHFCLIQIDTIQILLLLLLILTASFIFTKDKTVYYRVPPITRKPLSAEDPSTIKIFKSRKGAISEL